MAEFKEEVAQALDNIGHALYRLGNADAATPMGGLEGLGAANIEAAEKIAMAIEGAAHTHYEAMSEIADALTELAKAIKAREGAE